MEEKPVVKVETYYLDDDDNIVDEEKATRGIIRELDEDGNLVRETFGTFRDNSEYKSKTDEEIFSDMQELINRYKK